MKMNPVVHFEMPATDKKRAKKFYEEAFGWEMTQFGPEMGEYLLATTTPTDKKTNIPKDPGTINGGFFQKPTQGKVPHMVISVDDLDKHVKVVKKAGGKINGKPMEIPGIGKFVLFEDSEGNHVGMLQPSR